MPEKIG